MGVAPNLHPPFWLSMVQYPMTVSRADQLHVSCLTLPQRSRYWPPFPLRVVRVQWLQPPFIP